ncbi:endogenous retrovirus group FC1 Env polyprotein-like [Marmota flaviventris]|uniref:endogenous retrovirus group FC1 Env polyprotein-like n=1 Tax=Marmota flaviventris TaxID=93162 RepID=UPI003A8723BA
MYLFTLRERYSEHGMQKVRAVDATTCFIHNCTSISLKLSPSRTFIPDIPDPKAKRWDYVEFAVYARTTSARPTGWMTVGRTLITPPKATIQCFLCASLSRPLLAAVPLAAGNISAKTYNFSKKGQPLHVTHIPLWESYSTNTSFPFICFHLPTMNLLPICTLSYSTPLSPAFMQPGHFLWCNGSLSTSTINVSGTCFLVTVVPQLSLYTPTEFRQLALPSRTRRAVFLPVLVGLTLTTSVASLGLSGGAIGHALWASNDLQQKLQEALDTTAESLGSLQRQVTSLAQVALQNRRAIDLLTAEKGGTCLFLREECCYYVNESGLIKQNVVKLQKLSTQLLKPTSSNPITGFFQSSLATYLLPILGPLIGMLLFCALLPCIMKFLQTQLQKISNQTVNQLLLRHYQPLMTYEPPTSPREQFTQC